MDLKEFKNIYAKISLRMFYFQDSWVYNTELLSVSLQSGYVQVETQPEKQCFHW